MIGTGRYASFEQTREAADAAAPAMITVSVRRTNLGDRRGERSILEQLPPERFTILPNTAGCQTVQEAVRTARLGRELLGGSPLVKLEVLGEPPRLFPDMRKTLVAAEQLIAEGFHVLVYCSDDPLLCHELERMGCAAVMPLGSPIGSGMGITDPMRLMDVRAAVQGPLIMDAGVGAPSDAARAMEMGFDGVLTNTAIAEAGDPVAMARAMRFAVTAGRAAYVSGIMPKVPGGVASSPSRD